MKTSNKLLLIACVVILVSLFKYNTLLKAEYTSGRYKDPYRDFVTLNYKDFDVVHVNSATVVSVKIIQGDFKVSVDSTVLSQLQIRQSGKQLTINAIGTPGHFNSAIIISCPILQQVNVNAIYTVDKKILRDTLGWNGRQILIDGFEQNQLTINQDLGSRITLSNNTIKSLRVISGITAQSNSNLTILKNNQFDQATFDMRNKSKLILNEAKIHLVKYFLADSAELIVNGAADKNLRK